MTEPHRIFQVEIRTRDVDRAVAFYGAVFNWKIVRVAPDYALIDTGSKPIGAIMKTPDDDFPLGVCNYVLSADCGAAGQLALAQGGHIAIDKWEVEGSGWYVDTLDPWGNEMAFWEQARPGEPNPRHPGSNGFCWLEIPVGDFLRGLDYYQKLFGWTFQFAPGTPDFAYTEEGGLARGIGIIGGERAAKMRGVTSYVAVDDLAAAEERVKAAGGRVPLGRVEAPGEGGFFIFLDPDGNRLGAFAG